MSLLFLMNPILYICHNKMGLILTRSWDFCDVQEHFKGLTNDW